MESGEKVKKPDTKLSLKRKTRKETSNTDTIRQVQTVLTSVDELNESSEFVTCRRGRTSARRQVDIVTVDDDVEGNSTDQPSEKLNFSLVI